MWTIRKVKSTWGPHPRRVPTLFLALPPVAINHVLPVKIQERFLHTSGRRKEKVIIIKYKSNIRVGNMNMFLSNTTSQSGKKSIKIHTTSTDYQPTHQFDIYRIFHPTESTLLT